jgi:hypothetical protein
MLKVRLEALEQENLDLKFDNARLEGDARDYQELLEELQAEKKELIEREDRTNKVNETYAEEISYLREKLNSLTKKIDELQSRSVSPVRSKDRLFVDIPPYQVPSFHESRVESESEDNGGGSRRQSFFLNEGDFEGFEEREIDIDKERLIRDLREELLDKKNRLLILEKELELLKKKSEFNVSFPKLPKINEEKDAGSEIEEEKVNVL